jgi:hypothetical protein
MQKKEKHPPHSKLPTIEKIEPDVSLELLLEKDLNQKLNQSAERKKAPLEQIILKILAKRFKKR